MCVTITLSPVRLYLGKKERLPSAFIIEAAKSGIRDVRYSPQRTSLVALHMSAFGGKADMCWCTASVLLLTRADVAVAFGLALPEQTRSCYQSVCPGGGRGGGTKRSEAGGEVEEKNNAARR